MTTTGALFVFAHQDDEVAAAARILLLTRQAAVVWCAFLTDGRKDDRTNPDIRNRESIEVLTALQIQQQRILFPGTEIPIPDSHLVHHLDKALEVLERLLDGAPVDEIYCPAWEGGHQDHDASQLVAAAFAKRRGLLDRCFEFPLYRKAVGPLFRVLSPLPGDGWQTRRHGFVEGLKLARLPWLFRSQRRSWFGLYPEAFLKLAVLRRGSSRPIETARFHDRPHRGELFYERRFRFPYVRFMQAAAPFIQKHFP